MGLEVLNPTPHGFRDVFRTIIPTYRGFKYLV